MLRPARATIPVGRFDQRLRCCSSSYANRTACLCLPSSVARKEFAALTMCEVAVCAVACDTEKRINADTGRMRSAVVKTNASNLLVAPKNLGCSLTDCKECYAAEA